MQKVCSIITHQGNTNQIQISYHIKYKKMKKRLGILAIAANLQQPSSCALLLGV